MKKNSGNKIKLGMFITVGLFLFVCAIYYIGKKQQMFNSTFRLNGIFKDVRGLQVGNNVRFSGIDVGVVEDMEIVTDSSVRVSLVLDESTRKFIKKNAKATIGSDGLMGNKILVIIPGTSDQKIIQDNDYISTTVPVNVDDILAKLQVTGENAAKITGDLSAIMDNIRAGKGTVGKLFMDTTFAENLDKTVVNLKHGAGGFSRNMEAAKHSFLLRGLFKDKKTRKERREERKAERKKAKEEKSKN